MNTLERPVAPPPALIKPLTVAIDTTHALVTVDSPQLPAVVAPSVAQRLNRAASVDDALFKSSALKGDIAKNTAVARLQQKSGALIGWTSGLSAAGLGVLGVVLSPQDPGGSVVGAMVGGGGVAFLSSGVKYLANKALGTFVTPQALKIETLTDITTAYANADDVGRAMIGAQAACWISYLNARNVTGEFARRQLQTIVDARSTLPREAFDAGNKLNALARALRDEQGAPLSELRSVHATSIRSALQQLPEAYRADAAAYVMAKLYRNEVCRLHVPKTYDDAHRKACRELLATVVATLPMPDLTTPAPSKTARAGQRVWLNPVTW